MGIFLSEKVFNIFHLFDNHHMCFGGTSSGPKEFNEAGQVFSTASLNSKN